MKKAFSILAALTLASSSFAATPVIAPDLSTKTQIAPRWFGPNAFPVPEMTDGLIDPSRTLELAGDFFTGRLADGRDLTYDAFLRLHLPLWSDRAALTVWMPVVEWWQTDPAVDAARNILSDPSKDPGHDSGDVYVSLDIQLLTETSVRPSLLLRSVLKSASGNNFGYARYYDAPGYFFDLTAGKSFGPVRLAATTGFLCWQTDNGRQNDAIQYGLAAFYSGPGGLRLSTQWAGYFGWERYGDAPMTISARAAWRFPLSGISADSATLSTSADSASLGISAPSSVNSGISAPAMEPFIMVQHGLHDWPFTQLRAGLLFSF